jgi:exopolyphosphatase / guanosine-5'-triphosphate,3'-diphosphate pyrophosphatase
VKKNRLAAIDIGTNSIRSIVVEADPSGKFKILDDEKVTVRLGEGLNQSGCISPEAQQRAVEALSRLKKIIDGYGVVATEAVATSAVRKASNGKEFIKAIEAEIGLRIATVSGEEEAELVALSAFNNFDLEGCRHLMVDIGGGSLELVMAVGHHIEEIRSLELGAVYLTETYLPRDPIPSEDYQNLRRHIRRTLRAAFADARPVIPFLIGSGGTITAIAAMVMAARKEGYGSLHGYEVLRSEIVHLLAMLLRKSVKERKAVPGLNAERADIIVAGVVVIDELLSYFNSNLIRVNERGLREGLIMKGLHTHKLLSAETRSRSWRSSVTEFAASCHFDEEHSLQVARLALDICQVLSNSFKFGERERRLLEAAAILHDVGYLIDYSGHHKHSYHLIRHADLFGFTPRERELIAQIARYHRKALPKKKHEQFMRLAAADRVLVARLGGILRLADGLDRRRNSLVHSLDCLLSPGKLVIRLSSPDDISVELFGGKSKGDLFQEAFNLRLVLEPLTSATSHQNEMSRPSS